MLLGRLTLAAILVAASASGALGLAAMIGDTFVKLLPPEGFCELNPRYEFDGRAVSFISAYMAASENIKLLAMSADCDQLVGARDGKRQLDDLAVYLIANADIKMPTPFSVASACRTSRITTNSPIGIDVDARLASILEKINANQAASIGVIAEDDNACYTARVSKKKTDDGAQMVFVELQANAVVRTKAIMIRRQAVYQDRDTIKIVLPNSKAMSPPLWRPIPESMGPFADWWRS